ncbi:MAG TPA: AAA family ATPase [Longimicrobiales bacterium]|nr:AAA family ATPase [Longimicrobiales bacterium]
MPTPLAELPERLEALDRRVVVELDGAWLDMLAILDEQAVACAPPPGPDPESIERLRALRARAIGRCLVPTIDNVVKSAPDGRARAAIALHDRTLRSWIRLLPETVPLSGKQAAAVAEAWGVKSRWAWIARWRGAPGPLRLRAVATDVAAYLDAERARADAACLTTLANAMGQARRSWDVARLAIDATSDWSVGSGDLRRARQRANAARVRAEARGERALARRRAFLRRRFLPALGAAIVRGAVLRNRAASTPPRRRAPHPVEDFAADGVRAELALERGLEECTGGLLSALDRAMAAAMEDDAALDAELDRLVTALPGFPSSAGEPRVEVEVRPAAARLTDLDRVAEAEAESLPAELAIGAAGGARSRGRGRTVHPRRALLDAYQRAMRPSCAALFAAIEEEHREVAGDLQRACQVVAFAAGVVRSGDATREVVEEAVEHAVDLLQFRRSEPTQRPADGMRAAAVICRAVRDTRVALFAGRAGRVLHRTRRELERGVPAAAAVLAVTAARQLGVVGRSLRRTTRRFLARIGWSPDTAGGASHISIRPLLPGEFSGDPTNPELPSLYRHLFRPDPVKDARLLVGRAAELAAIADARTRWQEGHAAAVLVTGERGSGKTSLINCALDGPLEGLPVLRGEFHHRVFDPADLAPAVAAIVGAPDPARLEEYLGASKRVVVVEELERTFLRNVGHYEAARALGRLISATSESVLWIVVVNQTAFRFLDAAIGLGQRFSHRIHAGTATAEEIRQAILVRHNLSGLRLRFEAPAENGGARRELAGRFHRPRDPERAFFEMTARQSGGVYRTAFSIWLGHIGAIEDGLFTVKAPAARDLAPVIAGLSLPDLFSVVALMQHGSLTAAEHALVFQQPVEVSDAQIDELVARQIIARDPGRPGFRVRPEAMSAVHEALFRRNLL